MTWNRSGKSRKITGRGMDLVAAEATGRRDEARASDPLRMLRMEELHLWIICSNGPLSLCGCPSLPAIVRLLALQHGYQKTGCAAIHYYYPRISTIPMELRSCAIKKSHLDHAAVPMRPRVCFVTSKQGYNRRFALFCSLER